MAKPKPVEEKSLPKTLRYEVLQPLLNRETNELTEPGTFINMKEDLAEVFITSGAIRLAPLKHKKE